MSATSVSSKYGSKLLGKRILVIGGTSGIGFSVAEAAVEFGATVIICGSQETKLNNAIRRIRSTTAGQGGGTVNGHAEDLSYSTTVDSNLVSLLEYATEKQQKRLDHLVYTAGNVIGFVDLSNLDVPTITENGFMRFHVPILIGKYASKYMAHSHESSITFTSGYSNVKPRAGRVLMAGWAAGVEGVTRALAVDLQPVRVNCVCPGAVHTELFNRMPEDRLRPLVEKYVGSTLTRQIGLPEQVAEAYIYCMKDAFVDGTVLHSNGGFFLT
jgi:NAD(P)-dependent dehydrogenase (short-subunit alcohol dehydrogenase family)